MWELHLTGISSISITIILLLIVCGVFFVRSENISYNPCFYNLFKDDYQQFIIIGFSHSSAVATLTILQLLSHHFSDQLALHINGSLQIIFLIPTLLYYHSLVMNYQYRYMDVRNVTYSDFQNTYCVEVLSILALIAITSYASLLFVAETSFPYGIYSERKMDPYLAWTMDNYVAVGYALTAMGSVLLIVDFVRITRLTFRIRKVDIGTMETVRYQFQKYISKLIEPHYLADFFTLYLPVQYIFLQVIPFMRVNVSNVAAKGLIIIHPMMFTLIYMVQIKLATENMNRADLECECFVCERKKNRPSAFLQFISLHVMRLGVRNENNEMEEGDESGQPTETTPAIHNGQIELSEDSPL